ncbi:MAG TPA: 50S ribosomal protein L10 [Coriobacteriia bacterium]|nr:50S ribosomal protein L10 [Coriobacteriia bacterium]
MPTVRKEELVSEIKDRFNASEAVIMADYRGLTVKEMQQLRTALRGVGGEVKIYKNSLTEIAIRELALPNMDAYLAGPTAFIFIDEDPVAPAKALTTFQKQHAALELKGGLVQNQVVGAEGVKAIAALPSRDELIAKLLGTMQNPLTGTVRVLAGPARAFATVLDAIAKQKEAA